MSRIGIIIGSTRDKAAGKEVGEWLYDLAQGRKDGVEYTLLDLKEFDIPVLTTEVVPAAANKQYADEKVQAWSDAVDACDGFIFVTPEYNRSVPGPFKNAFDCLAAEWAGKPVAFVGYGPSGAVRAIEAWRPIVVNFSMTQLRTQLDISLATDMQDGVFSPADFKAGMVNDICAELEQVLA